MKYQIKCLFYIEVTGDLKTIAVIKSMLFNTIEKLILVPFNIQWDLDYAILTRIGTQVILQ